MKKIEFEENSDICFIIPHGEMTFFYLEDLDDYVKDRIKEDKYRFVYDMSDVNWIDSMGLGLMAMTVKNALLNNCKVCIIRPNSNVVELLRLSSLIDLLIFCETKDKAIEYFTTLENC